MSETKNLGSGIRLTYTENHVVDHRDWVHPDISYNSDRIADMVKKLIDQGITIRTAESCTGGGISNAITDTDGSSGIIDFCITAYSPEVKQKFLGIEPELTTDEKIVSMETSTAMNWGLQDICNALELERKCKVYISITGWIGSNPMETGYHAIFTLCNHENTLMSTFNVITNIGSSKRVKKELLIKRILLEVFDFVEAVKELPVDIVGPPPV